jgi:DNA repair protein RecN (Recombination protein N)
MLGERADRTLIREGEDSCTVEAIFELPEPKLRARIRNFLDENGLEPCEGDQLVLKRTLANAGTNRQFINGSPTTLNVLAAIGEWLLDMHGPHDHQSLLHPAKQLLILDSFGGLEKTRAAFADLIGRRRAMETEKSALIVDEKTYMQQLDMLRFQVQEISAARLQPGEDETVEEEFQRASNSARLLQLSQAALNALSESDDALLTHSGTIGRLLSELHRVDGGSAHLAELHAQANAALRELQSGLSRYADKVDLDPARLAALEERLNLLHTLKRKYGGSLAEVIATGDEAAKKLASLESRDAELARLNAQLQALDSEIFQAGRNLSAARKKVIPQLAKSVSRQLEDLGFKQSRFDIDQKTTALGGEIGATGSGAAALSGFNSSGLDVIEFQFAPNPGETARPLRAIASSGEMARVMLALKTVLAAQDEIPVLVFDEVDANVGGETANAVGEKMKQIAARRQVLCITHLPQVAASAEAHYVVSKQARNGRTISEIKLLDKKSRVTELARMLGGQTDAARKHAEALLK